MGEGSRFVEGRCKGQGAEGRQTGAAAAAAEAAAAAAATEAAATTSSLPPPTPSSPAHILILLNALLRICASRPKSQPMRCKMLTSAFLPLQAATGEASTLQRDQGQYTSTSKFTHSQCGLAGKYCPRPASGCGNGGEGVGGQPLHPRLGENGGLKDHQSPF